jgi:hypothetical protein
LVLCLQLPPWGEVPGAYLRLALPATVGANILLAASPGPRWTSVVLSNLTVVPGLMIFVFRGL